MVLACCNQTLLLLGAALLWQRFNSVIWLSERIIQTDAGPERHLDARHAPGDIFGLAVHSVLFPPIASVHEVAQGCFDSIEYRNGVWCKR